MKIILPVFLILTPLSVVYSQCNTTNATSCVCPDGSNECDLLPDITASWWAIENYLAGPNEYAQTGQGVNNGRLKITASTPNIGHGSLTVRGSDFFVCGTDTMQGNPGTCPNGSTPKQLIVQRIYHKNGNTMTYYDRWAGAMTYHPTHNHNHVDNWGVFTLRIQDPSEPDPRNWTIVGEGAKLGFCLMDYGTCSFYNNHCKDVNTVYQQGNTLLNTHFPNYGLGGGSYGCSVIEQGISAGYTDIYSENLDGMWINIPPGTCNGDYWIVAEIDPENFFLEEDTNNNYTAVPFTLTQQDAPGNPTISITPYGSTTLCAGGQVELRATAGSNYTWSTGETTQSIVVNQAGTYDVTVTNYCGTGTSMPIEIEVLAAPSAPTSNNETICQGQSAVLSAIGSNISWFNTNGYLVASGNTFTTPSLFASTTYFAADAVMNNGDTSFVGVPDTLGAAVSYGIGNQYQIFSAHTDVTIVSVKVFANGAGNRNFQILDNGGNLVTSANVFVPDGESRVQLNLNVPAGNLYEFRLNSSSNLARTNNTSGYAYPFVVQDTITIIGSSAGNNYWYFVYDWEVTSQPVSCYSPQTPVEVTVLTCTGVDEHLLSADNITLFPNPNDGEFNIEFTIPGTTGFSWLLSDITGRVILREDVQQTSGFWKKNVSIETLSSGLYNVSILIGNSVLNKQVVVSK